MSDRTFSVVLDNLAFAKCLRWHDARLWLSDLHDHKVWSATDHGEIALVVDLADMPAGLGWTPDGQLLVVSMVDRRLLRITPEGPVMVADLSALAPFHCHDMVVDATGRAYVGNFGFDIDAGDEPTSTTLVCVDPDGDAWIVVDQLLFPNGSVITDGGHTLVVAESFGQRLSAYTIEPDGSLTHPRVWADLRPNVPDGICLDADGAIWVADPVNNGVMRVLQGAGPVDWIPTERGAYSCALGGADGRNLHVATAETSNPARTVVERSGRIELVRVDVPGAER